jgi:hypothetical protein
MNTDKKYYLDLEKLKSKSIYILRYKKIPHTCKTSPLPVNKDVRKNILDICDNKFNRDYFNKLTDEDKKIILGFAKAFDFLIYEPDEALEEQDDLYEQFEITRGSYLAGNDSREVRRTLKSQILELMSRKRLGKIRGISLLYELSLID